MGKSQVCHMTIFSGALDKSVFDGITFLLKIKEENNNHKFVYVGGNMICSFLTNDKIINLSQIRVIILPPIE